MVLFVVKDLIPLKAFVFKVKRYYPPITYKKALTWIDSGRLPAWPRVGRERICVRISRLGLFLRSLGLEESTIDSLIQDLNS